MHITYLPVWDLDLEAHTVGDLTADQVGPHGRLCMPAQTQRLARLQLGWAGLVCSEIETETETGISGIWNNACVSV